MGLAGAGDLILTCTGELSRNRRVGLLIARGESLEAILKQLGHVAEGVHSAARRRAGTARARPEGGSVGRQEAHHWEPGGSEEPNKKTATVAATPTPTPKPAPTAMPMP